MLQEYYTENYKNTIIKIGQDFRRSIDYIESRKDFNFNNLSYFGGSWGSTTSNYLLAIDDRIKAAVLCVGGLMMQKSKKEVEAHYYIRRIKTPILHIVGKEDGIFGFEESYKPWKELIGTPKNKLKLISSRGDRDLIGSIKGKQNIEIIYLHAREIIEQLAGKSLDLGFSGLDLLKESEINIQNNIKVFKKYPYGQATLVVAIPTDFIDIFSMADLEEVAFEFKDKKKKRLRVATKYPNLTREFFYSKGVTQFSIVKSIGSTEIAPYTGSSEVITDITSTGSTLAANNLRIITDGYILKSELCMMVAKSSLQNKKLQRLAKLLSTKY